MKDKSPFFILANPRSGSSLLRIICDSHPEIAVPPESGFLEWWYTKYKNWEIKDSKTEAKVNAFCEDLKSSRKFETWIFNFESLKKMILNRQPENYNELINLVYINYGKNQGKEVKVWGDKNNYYIKKLKDIYTIFPNAKWIHLIRDGRDVACSYLELNKRKLKSKYAPVLPNEIIDIANEWDENNLNISSFFNSILKKNTLVVKYEDVVLNNKYEVKRICEFLNVEVNEKMYHYYLINKEKNIEPVEFLEWKSKTLTNLDKTNIGKYKEILTSVDIHEFNQVAKSSLEKFNYE
ncbi:sulfotransferase family protein [Lacinutrix himadriensis]|uniref:sulfotransferase family protein n=1 Tax=Lacinutrix himadriensis TaxID=641549 RepID=UPI0006E31E82|nr:sulfotransferase [Lacinutrix himadriensis]